MNDIFREYLDQFTVVYQDDILIYSSDLNSHEQHVRLVLSKLREHDLYAKYEKCVFKQAVVEFLNYIISPEGISTDQRKVAAIQEWQPPTRVRDVQSFLGFANFYCRFIKGFSKIVQPLVHPDPPKPFIVETDASDFAIYPLTTWQRWGTPSSSLLFA